MSEIMRKTDELCETLKQSDEYREFHRLKAEALSNDTQRALIEEYKKLQFKLQVAMAGGGQADPEEMERLQKIMGVLQFSSEAMQFIMAEMRLQKLLADIFQKLANVGGVDLDALRG